MDPRAELCLQRQILANSALLIARELEAGRAQAPFQEKLGALALPAGSHPVRAAILAASPEHAHALLADLLGPDYNVCKVVMPSRLGYSEVLLQERGFLLDSGNGPQEFAEADAFLAALQSTHALQSGDTDLEPLRVKLQGPAHLSGLGLLIPQSLETLRRKPALLSTLADQADWIFLVGAQTSKLDPDIRQTIQLVLEHSVGLQPVMVASEDAAAPPGEEWWKGWKATISLGPKRFDVPWKEIESQGYIAPADCVEVRITLTEEERLNYATAEQEDRYRFCSTTLTKRKVAVALARAHADDQVLVIGQYLDQLDALGEELGVPVIKGDTPVKERERLFNLYRAGEIKCLVVSKVANFSIDLPDATIAIQVSGTFGSRQEEAQRLGRILRPKADGRGARFYSLVARDTVDQDFAQNRQRFLADLGYAYRIIDADEILSKDN